MLQCGSDDAYFVPVPLNLQDEGEEDEEDEEDDEEEEEEDEEDHDDGSEMDAEDYDITEDLDYFRVGDRDEDMWVGDPDEDMLIQLDPVFSGKS